MPKGRRRRTLLVLYGQMSKVAPAIEKSIGDLIRNSISVVAVIVSASVAKSVCIRMSLIVLFSPESEVMLGVNPAYT